MLHSNEEIGGTGGIHSSLKSRKRLSTDPAQIISPDPGKAPATTASENNRNVGDMFAEDDYDSSSHFSYKASLAGNQQQQQQPQQHNPYEEENDLTI